MKRFLKSAAAAAAGLIIGIFLFFPWNTLAATILAAGSRAASANGIFLTAVSSEASGVFSKHFIYGGVKADFPIFRFTAREITVSPNILSSVFTSAKSGRVSISRGSVIPVTRQALEWNEGTADFSVKKDSILIENISFSGKTSVTGFMEISRATAKITRARMLIKVPPELDRMLNMVSMTGMIPLSKIKNGEWRIER